MKKFMIGGLTVMLLLTGCTTVNDRYEMEHYNYEAMQGKSQEVVGNIDVNNIAAVHNEEWEKTKKMFEKVEALSGVESSERGDTSDNDYISMMGVLQAGENMGFDDPTDEQCQAILKALGQITGKDLSSVMEHLKMDKDSPKEEYFQEIANGYGISTTTYSDYRRLEIFKSSLVLKDAVKQKWIEEIAGDDLLFTTVSKGEGKVLYELHSPNYITNGYYRAQGFGKLDQLQIITKETGDVEKTKMLLKREPGYEDTTEEEAQRTLAPLERTITSIQGNLGENALTEDYMKVNTGELTKATGKIGNMTYKIVKLENFYGCQQIQIIVK